MLIALIILFVIGGALIGLLLKLLKKPIKWILKLLLHALFGYIFLTVLNFVGAWFNISLDINWLTAIVSGVFGIPGVIVLLLLKYII